MKILVTSFAPFGGDAENASQEVMNALPDRLGDAALEKLCLPVAFGRAAELALAQAERVRPDAIVCLGQAGGRAAITPERVAINVMDARIPDNDGFQPVDAPVVPGGPAAYFSTLPIRAMAEAMRAAGADAQISNTAGTYVCNSLMYAVLHGMNARRPGLPCGFIHLPYLTLQRRAADVPGIEKETAVCALSAALRIL